MRLYLHRRIISGIALAAFVFGAVFPALAVARQALDPVAYATICRVDTGATDEASPAGTFRSELKSAHCALCTGSAAAPAAIALAPVVVAAVPELRVLLPRSPLTAADPAALQPLNPRAPPRR